jgi:3-phosphoshikimate 1-carboxyvinyltransferase
MNIILHKSIVNSQLSIVVTGSKSETNRLLLLQALYPNIALENISNSDDSDVMMCALESSKTVPPLGVRGQIIDVHHAGTAMRFLTSYFATQQDCEVVLTGSSRMKERPIEVLVTALNNLGADITYLETHGCPPLKIKGKELTKDKVTLNANVSSQYISALLLIAPKLKNGLELTLEGNITSVPYIHMTLALLNEIGVKTSFLGNKIIVSPLTTHNSQLITVESDWSSASYWYSIIALSDIGTEIKLSSYKKNSLQADAVLVDTYKSFGVETQFENDSIIIRKSTISNQQSLIFNLQSSPDIAQTIAVTCFGLGLECKLSGLHTLKIKETDRLLALKTELEKLGGKVSITNDSLHLYSNTIFKDNGSPLLEGLGEAISTYNDHRMAMAFAPLALKRNLIIEDAMVVSKSYPSFWEDLKSVGFKISEVI